MKEVHALSSVEAVAEHVAELWLSTILELQRRRRPVHMCLAGGRSVNASLHAARVSPLRAAVDWSRVHIWWADERFLPSGHPDRNESDARSALLDHIPLNSGHIHPIPGPTHTHSDPEFVATEYWHLMKATGATPDVTLLGMGPDGHIASLFPNHVALQAAEGAIALRDSPKPPPVRITLTIPALNRSREVWFVVTGSEKASAVTSISEEPNVNLRPASVIEGRRRTLWVLDADAALHVPHEIIR